MRRLSSYGWWPKWWPKRIRHWHIAWAASNLVGARIFSIWEYWPNYPDLDGDLLRIMRQRIVEDLRDSYPAPDEKGVVVTFFKRVSRPETIETKPENAPVREVPIRGVRPVEEEKCGDTCPIPSGV